MWFVAALLSAVFSTLTALLAKLGMRDVDSIVANAMRTLVILVVTWTLVFVTGKHHTLGTISVKSWLLLLLSGLSTSISSLLLFYALKHGGMTKAVTVTKLSVILLLITGVIFLHEKLTWRSIVGCVLIVGGTLIMAF